MQWSSFSSFTYPPYIQNIILTRSRKLAEASESFTLNGGYGTEIVFEQHPKKGKKCGDSRGVSVDRHFAKELGYELIGDA